MDKVLKGLCRRINTAINNLFNLIIFFTDLTVPFLHIRQLWFARTFARFSDILHTWWRIYDFLEWKISLFPITKWHSLLKEKKKRKQKDLSWPENRTKNCLMRAWAKALAQCKISPTTTLVLPFIVNQSVNGFMRIDEEKRSSLTLSKGLVRVLLSILTSLPSWWRQHIHSLCDIW